jgi:hypothetical protein
MPINRTALRSMVLLVTTSCCGLASCSFSDGEVFAITLVNDTVALYPQRVWFAGLL